MSSYVKLLSDKGLIKPPPFVKETQYEVIMGSFAYGVSNDMSDTDIYGFCIPPKRITFPSSVGYIAGFDEIDAERFEQFSKHHVLVEDREYDITIFNIIKYFRLCMDCNPNMIDSLFVPERCVVHASKIGRMVRDSRKLFLSKKAWYTFKGYAYSQFHKAKEKTYVQLADFCKEHALSSYRALQIISELKKDRANGISIYSLLKSDGFSVDESDDIVFELQNYRNKEISEKRFLSCHDFGWDVKYGYHLVRLINEVEQILTEGDIDLERNKAQLKAIRSGEMTLKQVEDWFHSKEKSLEKLYVSSTAVPVVPPTSKIKRLLMDCLEELYGSISEFVPKAKIEKQDVIKWIEENYEEV